MSKAPAVYLSLKLGRRAEAEPKTRDALLWGAKPEVTTNRGRSQRDAGGIFYLENRSARGACDPSPRDERLLPPLLWAGFGRLLCAQKLTQGRVKSAPR